LGDGILPFAEDGGCNQFLLDLRVSPATVKVCVHDQNFAILDIAQFVDSEGAHCSVAAKAA
jgi:hypothetical protein